MRGDCLSALRALALTLWGALLLSAPVGCPARAALPAAAADA